MRDQSDGTDGDPVTRQCSARQTPSEVIGDADVFLGIQNLKAIKFGQRTERNLAGHEEIAEELRIGRLWRRQIGEEPVISASDSLYSQ